MDSPWTNHVAANQLILQRNCCSSTGLKPRWPGQIDPRSWFSTIFIQVWIHESSSSCMTSHMAATSTPYSTASISLINSLGFAVRIRASNGRAETRKYQVVEGHALVLLVVSGMAFINFVKCHARGRHSSFLALPPCLQIQPVFSGAWYRA